MFVHFWAYLFILFDAQSTISLHIHPQCSQIIHISVTILFANSVSGDAIYAPVMPLGGFIMYGSLLRYGTYSFYPAKTTIAR